MFLKIGHRGARAYEPENTLRSFKKAIELGANAIEFDVRETKDKKLVVIHDENIRRITGEDVLVKDLTLKEIKELNIDGEKIPLLEEALDFIDKKVDKILVELKEVGIEKKVLDAIKERKLENVIIVSFHEDAIKKVRELDKKIETGLIYVRHPNPIKVATEMKANYLIALYRFIHTKNIQIAHENGLKVIVWTINTKEEAKEYVEKGVDGIASDKPDILKDVV
ncbi:MAG: glycerophosphodiester phosphodiesterase family protein [Candidatus Aenigmatarchaeota archaeon]